MLLSHQEGFGSTEFFKIMQDEKIVTETSHEIVVNTKRLFKKLENRALNFKLTIRDFVAIVGIINDSMYL